MAFFLTSDFSCDGRRDHWRIEGSLNGEAIWVEFDAGAMEIARNYSRAFLRRALDYLISIARAEERVAAVHRNWSPIFEHWLVAVTADDLMNAAPGSSAGAIEGG